MGDIIKKMAYQVPECFLRFGIFLAAYMAKAAINLGIAVEAVFCFPFF